MNKAEKEQALKISHLWKELAEKGTWFEGIDIVGVWRKTDKSPNLASKISEWRVAEPEKKIIDLTKCINTIDMEFADCEEGCEFSWEFGILDKILSPTSDYVYPYTKLNYGDFKCCRVRQNHIHFYNGIGNPLPDGLLVRLYFYDYKPTIYKSQDLNWDCSCNVSGFEVIDTLPEYKYE